MLRLKDKVGLITGGGAGIGRACVELFASEGAKVIVAEFNAETGEAAAQAARDRGGQAIFLQTDVSKPEEVKRAVALAVSVFGGLDIIYNNVGGSTLNDGPVHTMPLEEFHRKMSVDVFGTLLGCRFAVPEMIKRGGGSIINASSICGLSGVANVDAYSAAKGAVSSLTRSMAVEFAPHNIRVNAVAPATTMTERIVTRRTATEVPSKLDQKHLLGLVEPMHVAYAVLFLASDEACRTTGHILPVDSGYLIN
jgi:NAD(P)-dependent dehydrogenase (short-subunit alcohol dehydrogenase family)